MDYSKFISARSQARSPSAIRALMKYLDAPGMISLGAGAPNKATFPFASMQVTLKDGSQLSIDQQLFESSLQYSATPGLPQLTDFLRELQLAEHNPPHKDFSVSIGVGSQDLIAKAFEMVIEPGCNIMLENPSYTGIVSFLHTQPCNLVSVSTDAEGIMPQSLESILKNWEDVATRPKVLYTIPTGSNPTGVTVSLERKKAIYKICQEYDILIMEDDPYYFLQFCNPRVPSFYSMDVDGRVLRFDSLSKILSAGLRLGWVTGPKELVDRIIMHTMVTNLQASGVPQAMAATLLNQWGLEGFFKHIDSVGEFYREKRDVFLECAERRLKGYAEWTVPQAGMFVWLKLLNGITDSNKLITSAAIEKKVLAVPGVAFVPSGEPTPYVRVSFSNVTPENMDEALKRLAEVVQEQ
ncbi:pyridoxal phosphate-dependent transferase [Umbelopsis sp. AD052]|nr:pyridoxal phosphate-dependent transferase [Umbelopsis sp. AD052]